MFATLLTVALFAAPALQGVVAEFSVATPAITQCSPVQITWAKTTGPYNLIVVPAADPCGDVLADLGDHSGTSMTWSPTLPAGTKVMLSLEDANEEEAWSGEITIGESTDSSCLSADAQSSIAAASSTSVGSASVTASASSSATLTVVGNAAASPSAESSSSVVPVGAAGSNPIVGSNGASALQLSTPFMVASAFAAMLALSI